MIEHGAGLNVPSHNGLTPLHLAALVDKPSVGEVLTRLGADVDAQTPVR